MKSIKLLTTKAKNEYQFWTFCLMIRSKSLLARKHVMKLVKLNKYLLWTQDKHLKQFQLGKTYLRILSKEMGTASWKETLKQMTPSGQSSILSIKKHNSKNQSLSKDDLQPKTPSSLHQVFRTGTILTFTLEPKSGRNRLLKRASIAKSKKIKKH